MARPDVLGVGFENAARQAGAGAAEDGVEQTSALRTVELGESAPEQRQMLGEMRLVETLQPAIDDVAQGLVVNEALAAVFEEAVEEPCGVGDGAAGRKRATQKRRGVVRRQRVGFVEQARRGAGDERRRVDVLDQRVKRAAPGGEFVAGDLDQGGGAIGLVEIAMVKGDLRRRAVWLTEAGARRLEAAIPLWRKAQARLAKRLSADFAGRLAKETEKLEESALG